MKKIIKPRQTGKTTDLIEISEKTRIYILTANRNRAECVAKMAQEQNKNIPFPVTLWEYLRTGFRGSFINHILIDDAEAVLQELFKTLQIDALTMTGPEQNEVERIKALEQEPKTDQISDIRVTAEEAAEAIPNLIKMRRIMSSNPSHDRAGISKHLEAAIEAFEPLGKIKSELRNALKELAEERLANNRLMAVSGMSIEELTDAFMKGYRLVSPGSTKEE